MKKGGFVELDVEDFYAGLWVFQPHEEEWGGVLVVGPWSDKGGFGYSVLSQLVVEK